MNDYFSGKRVLITGGVGFIGSRLAAALVAENAVVTLIDSMIPQYGASLANVREIEDQVRINFSDIRDRHSLGFLVRDQDVVFSLAGQVSHTDSMSDPMTDLEINCRAQLSLLEACRRENSTARIIFASTRQIYGRPQFLPVTEEHPLNPTDVNGVNNVAAEMYYKLYAQAYGMSTFSLRLTNTYGPGMDIRTKSKGFLGVFVNRVLRGEPIRVFGSGEQKRDFTYVSDVVDALLLAAKHTDLRGAAFNLGHKSVYSLLEVIEVMSRIKKLEYSCVPFPEDYSRIEIGDYFGSYQKYNSATGWAPQVSLEEGLEKTFEFFEENPDRWM